MVEVEVVEAGELVLTFVDRAKRVLVALNELGC